ncbi:peptidylprolyl isomerase [Peptoniphilus asaccharolyticus]|uniref:peptidylprolyl isomerase n=2 Tax=Peptoniphilus asaccharolyticus TaxID=1258 RepID=UPI0009FF2321|nr:peptidylprolyl isomerase [Peptoniphilus asaccharolyticus]MBL7574802.1 peptidylprolyl isomerase [Peptoniphilus asaccharolyticus]
MNVLNLKKTMNRIVLGVGLSALLITTACGTPKKEGVAATVNGVDITQEEFVKNYASQRNYYTLSAGSEDYLKQNSPQDPSKTMDQVIKESVLNDLIDMEILKQDAEKMGIKADEVEVDKKLNEIKEQMGGQEAFDEQLKQMGSNEAYYREYFTNLNIMQQYYKAKEADFKATEDEIKKYYDEHKDEYFTADAAHILVKDVNEANLIKKELAKGADFAQIAKEKSTDKGTAEKGGELGEFSNGMMVKEFEDVVKSIKVGEISDPVESQFGFHIIKLNKFENKKLEEVKENIESAVTQQKYKDYLDKLKKDAKVEKFVNVKEEIEIPEAFKLPAATTPEDTKKEPQADEVGNSTVETKETNKKATENKAANAETKTEEKK